MTAPDDDTLAADMDIEIEDPAWRAALVDVEALVGRAARAALERNAADGLTILLADDETVRDLNHRFRGQDKPTNVLSFPAAAMPGHAFQGATYLGDIALAFGVCAGEAAAQGKSLADHLSHLVIHGVLHLLGYDHEEEAEAEVMEALEVERLARLGVADPYGQERATHAAKAAQSHG